MIKVAIIIGSTRPGRKGEAVGQWVYRIAQQRKDAGFELVDVKEFNLPLLDEPVPPLMHQYSRPHTKAWAAKIDSFDAFVFVTPEYNHATCGALKNAIDIASRPAGQSVWNGKPAGVVSQSPGAIGGFAANHHVRQTLVGVNVAVMPAPDPYIGSSATYLDEQGKVVNERTRETLGKFGAAFAKWIDANAAQA